MMTIHHRAATGYTSLGLPACPIIGKAPIYSGGHGWYDATLEPDDLFTSRDHTGVGIATGERARAWVLDVDGDDGLRSLRRLITANAELPAGPVCNTGGGGYHVWFVWSNRCDQLRNRVSFAPGLDVRTTGGGVVAPPSIHPDTGRRYEWRAGKSPYDLEFPAAPDWLLDTIISTYPAPTTSEVTFSASPVVVAGTAYAEGALRSAESLIENAPDGQQRHMLYRESLSIGARVVGPDLYPRADAEKRLVAAGMRMTNHRPRQKWTAAQVTRIVIDGLDAGERRVTDAA